MDGEAQRTPAFEETHTILRFRVARAELAFFASDVEEVTEPGEVTPIPCAPPHVPGLVALRGEALPIFDLACFFELSPAAAVERPRLLVVRSPRFRVGVLCDHVFGVTSVAASRIDEPRVSGPPAVRRYALGEVEVGSTIAALLDLDALLAAGRPR